MGTVLASDLTPEEQFDVILLNTFREIPQNEAGHFQGVLDFYFCGDPPRGDEPAPPERLLDWKKDALRIWGDFRVYAGIDLFPARMHWWQSVSYTHLDVYKRQSRSCGMNTRSCFRRNF